MIKILDRAYYAHNDILAAAWKLNDLTDSLGVTEVFPGQVLINNNTFFLTRYIVLG